MFSGRKFYPQINLLKPKTCLGILLWFIVPTNITFWQDKVVIQRLDQLCECVLKGEWPVVSKAAEALLQSQLAANSPMSTGLGDVDMASLAPGFAVGDDGLPEDPSKAFKLKRVSSNSRGP